MISIQEHVPTYIKKRLEAAEWHRLEAEHESSLNRQLDDYLERRSNQHKDPVMDFLFEYYAFRPSHLKRWSPGFGRLLVEGGRQEWRFEEMETTDGHAFLYAGHFDQNRLSSAKWILKVLQNSADRPPSFGCFGMHEWAMVYKAEHLRHSYLPLRMDKDKLARFVESRPLVCTHFDAYRFFTEEAKPRNKFEPDREKFTAMEQPGCLHTNMDLYKWAFKMYPWISSDTIRRAFELAVETRFIDMKASPYDLRERGLAPIKIETDAGRKEYLEKQRAIFKKSQPIRAQLISEYEHLIRAVKNLDS